MMARMEAMMEQLKTLGKRTTLKVSITTNPQVDSAYTLAAFPSLSQATNPGDMMAPLRRMSAMATSPQYQFSTYL